MIIGFKTTPANIDTCISNKVRGYEPPNSYTTVVISNTSDYDPFGDKIFIEIIQVK